MQSRKILPPIVLFILIACSFASPITDPTPIPVTQILPPATLTPAAAVPPLPTAQQEDGSLAIVGPEEIVFDWTFDACDPEDIPDLPARAFRDSEGAVHLVSSHLVTRPSIGPGLDELTHLCEGIFYSDHDSDPAMFNDNEWLASLYTEDGATIYAIVHHEYHGWEHAACTAHDNFACWYNALTLAVSTDGGRLFSHAAPTPDHFVAGLPHVYEDGAGPYGVLEPSNILKFDGNYYMMARVDDYRSDEQWLCLLRTGDLAAPGSWRAWDGAGFNLALPDPYRYPETGAPRCTHPAQDEIGLMSSSLTYNSYFERFVLLGITADNIAGREVWGVYYAFSDDLIHWTHRKLLAEVELPWTYSPGDPDYILYPTLLDPHSPSLSFDITGKTAYLYFTRFNTNAGLSPLDRDLVRIPVEYFETESEAAAADTRTRLDMTVVRGVDGPVTITGALTTIGSHPVEAAGIELVATPSEGAGEYFEYRIEGLVPPGAGRALTGFRVNMECGCEGVSDFVLYEMRYTEDLGESNRIPNPDFSGGLGSAAIWGDADVALEPSDRGNGQMLHIQSGRDQEAGGNLVEFTVTPGARFSMTFAARISPQSLGSGYLTLIFIDTPVRLNVPLAPAAVPIGTALTGPDGSYQFTWETPFAGRLQAIFPGAGRYLPAQAAGEWLP